uniref:Uncharacterized protein n=1 Tax=Falco tinnunculus TaxID=100819 RepID=A0A8C4U9S3_FALTI
MESCRALALCAVAAALLLGARGQGPTPPRRARDLGPPGGGGASREKELIEALQEVLEKLKSKRVPHYEKKFGQVPMVSAPEGRGGRWRRDGTGRDGTGRDGTGRDGTGRDGTGRDGTGPGGTGRPAATGLSPPAAARSATPGSNAP